MSNTERIYFYRIDTEGRLWIEGTELNDPQVLKFFMRRLEKLPSGKFQVLCMGERNIIDAADVPYVIQAIEYRDDRIELVFPGNYREILDPNTLFVGAENVLYCKIRNGDFTARFNRKTYLELTHHVSQDENKNYVLQLAGQDYPIAGIRE